MIIYLGLLRSKRSGCVPPVIGQISPRWHTDSPSGCQLLPEISGWHALPSAATLMHPPPPRSQKAVTAYLKSKQLLPFGFVAQSRMLWQCPETRLWRRTIHLTRDLKLNKCWACVEDGGPTLNQHWLKVSRLLGYTLYISPSYYTIWRPPSLILVTFIVPLGMKGCICHFKKWQIHPFISKRTF